MTDNAQPHCAFLVDKDGGLVNPRIFVDRDIYQRELAAIFVSPSTRSAPRYGQLAMTRSSHFPGSL